MRINITILLFLLFQLDLTYGTQIVYYEDFLGDGFECATIDQGRDYEGEVVCTVIRRNCLGIPRKAVLYVHGFNDYFFQKEMAQKYNDAGFNFYAIDLRKYGRSILPHQKISNVRNLKEYFADIDTVLNIMKAEGNEVLLLSGHSTGGLTVSLYAHEYSSTDKFDAVFLNSPFYDMNLNWFLRKLVLPFLASKGKKNPDKIQKRALSELYGSSIHNSKHGEWDFDLNWKPLASEQVNYGWINAIYTGQKQVAKGLIIEKPVLVMFPTKSVRNKEWNTNMFDADAVLNVKHIKKGAQCIESSDLTIIEVKNGMHDLILSKREIREKVYHDIFEWAKKSNL